MQNGETDFIKSLEDKRGGEISYREISLYYADSSRRTKDAVFVYQIGDRVYLEDFEKEFRILGIKVLPPKGYKYEKFEAYFCISDLSSAGFVLRKDVEKFVKGKLDKVKEASKISGFFQRPMLKLSFKDGSYIFMELLDHKKFAEHLGLIAE